MASITLFLKVSCRCASREEGGLGVDRKSTRLNSSHPSISYAVFCLKKKKLFIPGPIFYLCLFSRSALSSHPLSFSCCSLDSLRCVYLPSPRTPSSPRSLFISSSCAR